MSIDPQFQKICIRGKSHMKLNRFSAAILAIGMTAFLVSDSMAQEGTRRDRGGFGGGPGGPGGRGGDPTMGLLRFEEVKTELKVSDEQQQAIDKLAEQNRASAEAGDRPNFREMSEEERGEFLEKMRRTQVELAKQTKEQLEEVLLPEQIERLEQISLQVRGAGALEDEEVREQLQMSDDQIAKLAETRQSVQTTMRERMQELFQSGDRDAMREAFGKIRAEMEEQLFGVLTDEQKSKFQEMKGEPFKMPEQAFGGGRGPGGFGGPGGGRRGGDRQRAESE